MRTVAVALLMMVVLAAMPAAVADNECRSPCQPLTAPGKTYYLYAQAATCVPPGQGQCAGQPDPLLMGLVYEESGSCTGLQRYDGVACAKDLLVLV